MSEEKNSPVNDDIFDPEEMFLTVELDEGGEETFRILSIFEVEGQDYIAVSPLDDDETVYFYRHFEDEEGNPSIGNIESDDEFEAVIDAFDELLDEAEFEEM